MRETNRQTVEWIEAPEEVFALKWECHVDGAQGRISEVVLGHPGPSIGTRT
jgi:CO dehydrogenase/acetyl-CoA synthase delta subunit